VAAAARPPYNEAPPEEDLLVARVDFGGASLRMLHNESHMARFALVVVGMVVTVSLGAGQAVVPGATHRVFLKDGQALPSYGESVLVDDRLVFTLLVGGTAGRNEMQLMSLPASTVDLDRTSRYAASMRAAHYAATRGEADYAAVTTEVQRALDQLKAVDDPKGRLALAEGARKRLLTWSEEHYSYRAPDVRELAGLFDQVIAELRAAAGESQFTLELHAGPAGPVFERLAPAPGLRESIALALSAASVADVGEDRIAVLRATAALLDREPGVEDLRDSVKQNLEAEQAAETAYASLASTVLAAADAGMRRGDVAAVISVRATVVERDRALGLRRPQQIQSLLQALEAKLEATRAHRLALDRYASVRPSLLAYERRVRSAMSALDGLAPVIAFIREMKSMGYERLERADNILKRVVADFPTVTAPSDLADMHSTLVSAAHMASEAISRRRLAVATLNMRLDHEASTAAAGAQLLIAQAREMLVKRLFPPKLGGS